MKNDFTIHFVNGESLYFTGNVEDITAPTKDFPQIQNENDVKCWVNKRNILYIEKTTEIKATRH